jgi:hypothetical protein
MTAISQMRDGRGDGLARAKLMWQVSTVRHHDVVVPELSTLCYAHAEHRQH